MLSDTQIKQYQNLYKRRFNGEISQEEAGKQGERLIRLVKAILPAKKPPRAVGMAPDKK